MVVDGFTQCVCLCGGEAKIIWGVKIKSGMKPKDLPLWFAPIFEQKQAGTLASAGLEPLRFRGGKFYAVEWKQQKPTYSHEATETEINDGDWLFADHPQGQIHVRGYSK